jgi:hypothetical protein
LVSPDAIGSTLNNVREDRGRSSMAGVGFEMVLGAAAVLLASGCSSAPNPIMGLETSTQTYASHVTLSDGKPAYSVHCNAPAACQTRALAICANGP